LGRDDFLKWFEAPDSDGLAEMLCEKYQVNGQTAWSLLKKTERFDVRIVTSLDKELSKRMRMGPAISLSDAMCEIHPNMRGYTLPFGAKLLVTNVG
ncbi:MAG: hypothetical protein ABJB40_11370, partial [Acidobacteriota bacterium]